MVRMEGTKTSPTREDLDDGTTRFCDAHGWAGIRRLAPGVLLIIYSGRLHGGFYLPLIAEADRALGEMLAADRKLSLVADCWELRAVDTAFREQWLDWLKHNTAHVDVVLGLINSKLIVMAANIMSMLLGNGMIRTYSDIGGFEAAVERQFPGLHWATSHRALAQAR
jgi:hypothetical protein